MEITEISDQEAARWKKALDPVIDNYVKDMVKKGYSEAEVRGWISYYKQRMDYYTPVQAGYALPSAYGPPQLRAENIMKIMK